MPCCGKAAVSKKLTNREYSAETLEKMKEAALARIRPPSEGQDWRRTTEARQWEKKIKLLWNNECAITGSEEDVNMHHFYSGVRYKSTALRDLLLYNVHNGIRIHKVFHTDFHKRYGYQGNTIKQFQEYVKHLLMLISSQADWKQSEGSETRVNDPLLKEVLSNERLRPHIANRGAFQKRIMKLQERLEELSYWLDLEIQGESS